MHPYIIFKIYICIYILYKKKQLSVLGIINACEIDRNYLILTINKRLFTMIVENHETTKLGNQHENLLKREIQRM
jgi:hypothetical protein